MQKCENLMLNICQAVGPMQKKRNKNVENIHFLHIVRVAVVFGVVVVVAKRRKKLIAASSLP